MGPRNMAAREQEMAGWLESYSGGCGVLTRRTRAAACRRHARGRTCWWPRALEVRGIRGGACRMAAARMPVARCRGGGNLLQFLGGPPIGLLVPPCASISRWGSISWRGATHDQRDQRTCLRACSFWECIIEFNAVFVRKMQRTLLA